MCRFKSSYRDALLDGFPDTTYFDYGFGGDFYHRLWSEVRIVFTSRPTRHNQRYSTQQLYAGESGPAGWDIGYQGAIDELEVMRPEEFATKDYNNAPFVAAGWKWQARPVVVVVSQRCPHRKSSTASFTLSLLLSLSGREDVPTGSVPRLVETAGCDGV